MRKFLLSAAFLAVATSSARAQESQQDVADRIVREQEDFRRRSVDRALGAPTRVIDRMSDAVPTPAAPAAPTAPSAGAPSTSKSGSWKTIACVVAAVAVLAYGFRVAWRRAAD